MVTAATGTTSRNIKMQNKKEESMSQKGQKWKRPGPACSAQA